MKTAELVQLLSEDAGPVRARPVAPRLLAAGLVGGLVSLGLLLALLGLRPLGPAMATPSFWMKGGYTLVIALAGLLAAVRLARPGGRIGAAAAVLAFVAVCWLAMMGMMETMRTPAAQVHHLWMGDTWRMCPWRILILALPVCAATLWVLRRLAPTRPGLAGAAAGVFAGAVGATVYGFYCQETTAAFVVVWYTLGIAASGLLGALIGARLLRW